MLVLGIESTCDETSVGIVEDGKNVLANIISSQIDNHAPWKGVVPEIASRLHLEKVIPVIDEALNTANVKLEDIDVISAANMPGLIGGLIVGVSAGKAMAWMHDKPFIGINHIEAHLYSPHLGSDIEFPYIALLVSGGHTMIVRQESFLEYTVLGTTIDDAVGEAFDKIAKFFDLGYPGGPAVERTALTGDEKAFNFPISNLHKSDRKYDVSYSGIKTAVIHHLHKFQQKKEYTVNDIAASFQKRAFDVLLKKVERAAKDNEIKRVVVAGGVSANKYLRNLFENRLHDYKVYFPGLKYATDNGAMIAGYAYYQFKKRGPAQPAIGVSPRVQGYKISLERGW